MEPVCCYGLVWPPYVEENGYGNVLGELVSEYVDAEMAYAEKETDFVELGTGFVEMFGAGDEMETVHAETEKKVYLKMRR